MPIFSVVAPIEISKFIFDYFLYESCCSSDIDWNYEHHSQKSENALVKIFIKMLIHVDQKCLNMHEPMLFEYLKGGEFIIDCFREFKQIGDGDK